MKLHRLVIAFIVASGAAVLVAGLWFKTPSFPASPAKNVPAAAVTAPTPNPIATLATATR